jgi:hypothetical protein
MNTSDTDILGTTPLARAAKTGIIHVIFAAIMASSAIQLPAQITNITIDANTVGNTWNQWINTGVTLNPGDTLTITATGLATSSNPARPFHGPNGASPTQSANATESLVNTVNLGALVGMIDYPAGSIPVAPTFTTSGMYLLDAGSTGIFGPGFVGASFSQIIPALVSGTLFLGFNDGFDADNAGSYDVSIAVTAVPEPASTVAFAASLVFLAVAINRSGRRTESKST